jgi:hypothetical protein
MYNVPEMKKDPLMLTRAIKKKPRLASSTPASNSA